jgi:hypothetical protein
MNCRQPHSLIVAVLCCAFIEGICTSALSAEPTAAEGLVGQLLAKNTPEAVRLAKQWQSLVRQRQWVDAAGKHKTFARYLDHDREMKWVKLRVAVKVDTVESYKDVKVDLTKLDKKGQLLVKQIAQVRKSVEEALGKSSTVPPTTPAEAAIPTQDVFPQKPSAETKTQNKSPWRTDFAEFRKNLSATKSPDGKWISHWGQLSEVQAVWEFIKKANEEYEQSTANGDRSKAGAKRFAVTSEAINRLGEVTWEMTLKGPVIPNTGIKHDLALPEPFKIDLFFMARDAPAETPQFQAGDRVRFVGRFMLLEDFKGGPTFTLFIRSFESTRTSTQP